MSRCSGKRTCANSWRVTRPTTMKSAHILRSARTPRSIDQRRQQDASHQSLGSAVAMARAALTNEVSAAKQMTFTGTRDELRVTQLDARQPRFAVRQRFHTLRI